MSEWILAIVEEFESKNANNDSTTPQTNYAALRHKPGGSIDAREANARRGLHNLYKPYEPAPVNRPSKFANTTRTSRNSSLNSTPKNRILANTGKHVMFNKEISVIKEENEELQAERLLETTNGANLLRVPKAKFGQHETVNQFWAQVNEDNDTNDHFFSNKKSDFVNMGVGINALFLTQKFSSKIQGYQLKPKFKEDAMKRAYSKNYHKGFLDMDVVYEKRRAAQAKRQREREEELRRKRAEE